MPSNAPVRRVVRGSWADGTAQFNSGSRAADEADSRWNRSAVALRKRREALELSASLVARWAGLDRNTVGDLEDGRSTPDVLTVFRVAAVLGVASEVFNEPTGQVGP